LLVIFVFVSVNSIDLKKIMMKPTFTLIGLIISIFVSAQGIIEFRGVERSGHYNESNLLKEWPENGPELIQKIENVGKGYSQAILVDETIFVTGIKEDTIDILSAFNLNGELLWDVPYGRSWTRSYIDSRSTPTYESGNLYIVSGTCAINCIDATNGKIIWQVDAMKEYGAEPHKHGESESLVLSDNAVVYTTGGEQNTMIALDKNKGTLIWKSKSLGGAKSYASASLINHNGQDIILAQTMKYLLAINPLNGEIIWKYDLIQYHLLSQGEGAQSNIPLYKNGELFVTSGYDHPGIMLSLADDGKSVELKWRNDTIDTHHGGVVLVDENIFGSNWQNNANGKWASVNWETGETNWEQKWENKGSVISADGMLYLYEEKRGNVALVEPSSDSLKIISTFKVDGGIGPHWAHPAIYDGKLFIRHGDVLMIYDIKE
jgi:outer membrane protein assembly factor BamB